MPCTRQDLRFGGQALMCGHRLTVVRQASGQPGFKFEGIGGATDARHPCQLNADMPSCVMRQRGDGGLLERRLSGQWRF